MNVEATNCASRAILLKSSKRFLKFPVTEETIST
nr:unnamed protein product [Callosobruchus chinensis]